MRINAVLAATAASAVGLANGEMLASTYTGTQGLNDLAKANGKYMGTATDLSTTDAEYTKELQNSADWGFLTPGNAMKWDATEPSKNTFQFARGDALVAEAKKIGAKVRCHTLTWHSQTPQWVQSLAKDDMLDALKNHITKVMTHFGDSCAHWDVLNEALNEDGTYRNSFWYQKTGTEFIKVAFQTAAAVKKDLGLSTKLFYNDYNTDRINAKSTGALNNIVKLLQTAKIEIDGVGFQSHLTSGQVASTADQIANLKRFTDLGLEVALTELDITVKTTNPSAAQQKQQATDYQNTIAACKQLEGCVGVTVWDFSDQWSWINNDSPLPFYQAGGRGSKVVRKLAYDGIVNGWGVSGGSASGNTTVAPKPASNATTPVPASSATPKPAATTVTPEPAAGDATPKPAPSAVTPKPTPSSATPEPAAGDATPKPAPSPAAPTPAASSAGKCNRKR